MQIEKMERAFRYREGHSSGGINLPDPDPSLDPENVRTLFCATFPEITTAALTGPEVVEGKLVWTFTKAMYLFTGCSRWRAVAGRHGLTGRRRCL
jgi:PRTRC genetic system protein C